MAIKDYSTTPDLNTQISGINIAEGCAPSGINNAIRQLMADVKAEKDSRDTQATTQAAKDAEQDAAIAGVANTVSDNATTQAAKDAAQDSAIAGKLDKSGGTMTGNLEIQDKELLIKKTSYTRGSVPSSEVYHRIVHYTDKNGTPLGIGDCAVLANTGRGRLRLLAYGYDGTAAVFQIISDPQKGEKYAIMNEQRVLTLTNSWHTIDSWGMVFSNGFKIQGGRVVNSGNGPIAVSFNVPFTSHVFPIGMVSIATDPQYSGESYNNLTLTGFELYHRNATSCWAVAGF